MEDALSKLFNEFDCNRISRRHLLQAFGLATVASPLAAFGQGRCSSPETKGTPGCNTTPMPAPFEPTGWKTILLDHFSLHVVDLEKEAAFYNALMGWKVRSNDGKTIVMDMGKVGGVLMRGGLVPADPEPARGNGGGNRGGGGNNRTPVKAVWDGFCFGIEPWDTKKVEAALKTRGLNPVADHNAKENFYSFHVKDPDGFDLQISNGNAENRRTTPANGRLGVEPLFEPTGWQTVYLDHISFRVSNYKESVAFYKALLSWIPGGDEGSQDNTTVSPEIGGLLIRGNYNAYAPGAVAPTVRGAAMDHIAFGITPFDPDKVKAELEKRHLTAQQDTGSIASSPAAEKDIHTASYKSYHTRTPNNFNLQISNHTSGSLPNTTG
jgi:catechol 2,3-dioxygenase-like lactoylglutathione lyase family enzyme